MESKAKKNKYKADHRRKIEKTGRVFINTFKLVVALSGLIVLSVLLIFIHDLITQTEYFRAKTILVDGIRQLSRETVLQQAKIHVGESVLSMNLNLTRRRLLAHPWIVDATVKRQLPDTVEIRIQEEKPMAVVDLGELFLINEEGEIFKKWASSDPKDLPVIRGFDFSDIRVPGAQPSEAWEAVLSLLKLARIPSAVFPIHGIEAIHADSETGIALCLFDGGKTAHLGHRDFAVKLRVLGQTIFQLNAIETIEDFDSIDAMETDRIIVSPVRSKPVSGSGREA